MAVPAPQTLNLSTGSLSYLDAGSGPTLLLLHGSPVSSLTFEHQFCALSPSFRVICPDLPGFGGSAAPARGADFEFQFQAICELIGRLDLKHFSIGGHDWGGPIALACAAHFAPRIDRLILINTTADPSFQPPLYWRPFVGQALGELAVVRLNSTARALPSMLKSRRHRARYLAQLEREETRRTVLNLEQLCGFRSLMRRSQATLRSLAIPTLILWGTPDPYFRIGALRTLQSTFPDAQLRTLGGGGHFPQEDVAEAVTRALQDFLG